MNVPVWVAWVVVVFLAVVSVSLLMGKSDFLNIVAGYSTMSKEKRQTFSAQKLCRVVGGGISLCTIFLAVCVFYEFEMPPAIDWLIPWGILGVAAVMIVLGCTVCKAEK